MSQDMKRREQWSHIINISSMAGHRVPDAAGNNGAFYAATKHALRAITEGLRQEVSLLCCAAAYTRLLRFHCSPDLRCALVTLHRLPAGKGKKCQLEGDTDIPRNGGDRV